MVKSRTILAVMLPAMLVFGGCSAAANASRTQSGPMPSQQKLSDAQIIANAQNDPKVRAMLPKMAPGTRVLYLSSVTINDNSNIATFPATARLTRTNNKLTVFDPQSGQTFAFHPNSRVSYLPGGSRVFVAPGKATPSWIPPSAIEKTEVPK